MTFKKTVNNHLITVANYSNVISIKDLVTGVVTNTKFSDHIQAILAAKSL